MNYLLLGVTAVMAAGFVPQAHAAIYEVGTLNETPWVNASHGAGIVGTGSFVDTYNFNLSDTHTVSAAAISLTLRFGNASLLHIKDLGLKLFDAAHTELATEFTPTGDTPINVNYDLDAGNYHFEVSGNADGAAGGAYLFSLVAVDAIPEPAQWLTMALGLGMVGIYTRRLRAQARS